MPCAQWIAGKINGRSVFPSQRIASIRRFDQTAGISFPETICKIEIYLSGATESRVFDWFCLAVCSLATERSLALRIAPIRRAGGLSR
jgi:hypothetical protein